MHWLRWIAFIFLSFFSLTILAGKYSEDAFQANLIFWGGYGWTNGFLQIPDGGQSGTSSIERPTFSEIGINGSGLFSFTANLIWHHVGIYGAYLYNRPNGKAIITNSLITHNVFIPAGTFMKTNTRFDIYRFGLNYLFYLCRHRLLLFPLVEGAAVDFLYRFQIPAITSSREFHPITFRIGLGGNYFFTKKFGIDFQLISSIPDLLNTDIYSGAIHFNYQFFHCHPYSGWLFVGIGFLVIQFKDQQLLPNHVNFHEWPIIEGGLAFHF